MRFLFILLIAAVSTTAVAYTVKRLGSSCQVCTTSGNVTVCKFYKKCPIKEEKE